MSSRKLAPQYDPAMTGLLGDEGDRVRESLPCEISGAYFTGKAREYECMTGRVSVQTEP